VEVFSEHVQDLTEIISLMAEGLSAEEKASVDKAILQTYKEHGFNKTKKTKKKLSYPRFKDFYITLKSLKQKKLCARLEKFYSGSLAQFLIQKPISILK